MEKSFLVTNANAKEFVQTAYGIPDAVLCIWVTENPPSDKEIETYLISVDDTMLFLAYDIKSLFFPKGFKQKCWNPVLACLKTAERPILGYIRGIDLSNLFSDNWLDEYEEIK